MPYICHSSSGDGTAEHVRRAAMDDRRRARCGNGTQGESRVSAPRFAPRLLLAACSSLARSYARAERGGIAIRTASSPAVYATAANAPVKAFDQKGESPFQARRYRPVVDSGNCVSVRKGGEQPETNDQSVTKVNSIRPSLSGRILAISEPWTVRRVNPSILWISPWDRHGQPRRCSNG